MVVVVEASALRWGFFCGMMVKKIADEGLALGSRMGAGASLEFL